MRTIKIKHTLIFLAGAVVSIYACQKKFDAGSYAPEKPFGGYTNSKEIAPGNLVAYWGFNGNLTDSISKSSGVNTGTGFAGGKKGQALKGADSSYVIFDPGSSIQGLQNFTISFWMNIPQMPNGALGLLDIANTQSFWGNVDVFIDGGIAPDTAKFSVHVNNAGKDGWFTGKKIPGAFGKWMHIAITYDAASSTFNLYANGSPAASMVQANYGPLQFQNATKLVFGTLQFQTNPSLTSATTAQSWARYLTGSLDEVRIYNKALPASDINSLYKLEAAGR